MHAPAGARQGGGEGGCQALARPRQTALGKRSCHSLSTRLGPLGILPGIRKMNSYPFYGSGREPHAKVSRRLWIQSIWLRKDPPPPPKRSFWGGWLPNTRLRKNKETCVLGSRIPGSATIKGSPRLWIPDAWIPQDLSGIAPLDPWEPRPIGFWIPQLWLAPR